MSDPSPHSDHLSSSVADLFLSFAVVLLLLLAASLAVSSPSAPDSRQPIDPTTPPIRHPATTAVAERVGVPVQPDPRDPSTLVTVMPQELLAFQVGRSELTAQGAAFVQQMLPRYAELLCGEDHLDAESFQIEGHTDDLGSERLNLRLSQDRALAVLFGALDAIEVQHPALLGCFHALASASGRGDQDLLYQPDRTPDRAHSRRVVFKIRLRASGQAG